MMMIDGRSFITALFFIRDDNDYDNERHVIVVVVTGERNAQKKRFLMSIYIENVAMK